MTKYEKITIASVCGVLLACFAFWAYYSGGSILGLCAAGLCVLLFCAIFATALPGLFRFYAKPELISPDDGLGPRSLRFARRHPWLMIALWVIALRLVLYVAAYAIHTGIYGYTGGIWDTLRALWLRTDSPSYLGIAENWYVTTGDPKFHIVFFPLYPLLMRGVWFLFHDWFVCAMVVSNLFSVLGAVAFYELAALDLPRKDALRALKYLLLFPAAFFFGAPMTESVFLFLSVTALVFARKRLYLPACLAAGLAAFSRLPGILLAVPLAMECAWDLRRGYIETKDKRALYTKLTLRALCLLLIPLGLLGYVAINYSVTGDAFTFLRYQSEHWGQSLSWFFNSPAYIAEHFANALAEGNAREAWGLFLPNLVAIFASLGIVLRGARTLRPSYTVYFLVYLAITTGATWLLSAPRYMAVAFPVALALAQSVKSRRADMLVTAVCVALLVVYMGLYVLGYPVY
jgi:hypothetical protein